MRIDQRADQSIEISDLDTITAGLLRAIPSAAQTDDPRAEHRIYSTPTAGAEPEFDEEWNELVGPDLRHLFQSAIETIEQDLSPLARATDGKSSHPNIVIPSTHFDAWLNGLNQARLATAARHGLDTNEENLDRAREDEPSTPAEEFARFQVHFYGLLQEFLLRLLADQEQ